MFDYLYEQVEHYPQQKSVGAKTPSGWYFWSTEQLIEEVRKTSLGLIRAGIQPGDKVATVVFRTIPEWVALDQALLQIGALNVPMYPTISPSEYAYILKESGVKLCVVGDDELYAKVNKASEQAPDLQGIYSFASDSAAPHWRELQADEGDEEELERRKAAVKPEDIATIIYTSGTTGNPKGVMLTHRNIAYNVESLRSIVNSDPGERVISFLPVSHIFERAAVYYFLGIGAQVHFTDTQ